MRIKRLIWVALFVLGMFCLPLRAQTASSAVVGGTVKDPSGAVIPGAQVVLIDTATNASRTATSNEAGQYLFPDVAPGSYTMTATKEGFQSANVTSQRFDAARSYTVDVPLQLGTTRETVQVNAAAVTVELQSADAQVGNTLPSEQFQTLPTLSRDTYELLALQPGAAPQFNNRGTDTYGGTGGGVSGALSDQNAVTLDGLDISAEGTGGVAQLYPLVLPIPVEGVSEFRVGVANQNASFGRTSGGQVSMVSSSGSNSFHGAAYYFLQNSVLNANTWENNKAGVPRAVNRDNRGGVAFGGPIQKDKTFFFANVEFRRFYQGIPYVVTIPSDALRQGLITINGATGPGCTAVSSTAGQCDVKAFDPRGLGINPSVRALWSFFPKSGSPNHFFPAILPFGGTGDGVNTLAYQANLPAPRSDNLGALRLDHSFNSNIHGFARFQYNILADAAGAAGVFQYDIRNASSGTGKLLSQFVQRGMGTTVGIDQVISSNLINSVRAAWIVQHNDAVSLTPRDIASQYNIPAADGPLGAVSLYLGANNTPNGLMMVPVGVDGQTAKHTHILTGDREIKDDLTWVKGTHSLAFGGDYLHLPVLLTTVDHFGLVRNDPDAVVEGDLITFPASTIPAGLTPANATRWQQLYSTALGIVENTSFMGTRNGNLQPNPIGSRLTVDAHAHNWYFYAQDTWRMKPSLTLTYGLGYGWMNPFVEKQGRQSVLVDHTNGDKFIKPSDFIRNKLTAARTGQVFSPTLAYESYKNLGMPGFWFTNYGDVAPRASAAWSPSGTNGFLKKVIGEQKTVLRGGYSMVYDRIAGTHVITMNNNPGGFSQNFNVTFPNCSASGNPGAGCDAASTNPAASAFRLGTDGPLPVVTSIPPGTVPFLISGATTGGAASIGPYFKPGREHLIDFTIQRQLGSSQVLEVAYVARLGRGLYQGLNLNNVPYMFMDPASGQSFAQAFDQVANQLRAGVAPASVTVQPWFENQVPLSGLKAIGVNGCATATTSTRCLVNLSTVFTNGAVNTLVNQNAATINNARIAAGLAPLTTAPSQMTVPVTVTGNNGMSNYHGLLVTWRNNGWHGLTYDLNYTFSKALDNGLAAQANFPTAVNSFDPRSNYGFSTFDRTHIFNGLFRYNLPLGKDGGGINRLLGGWYVSGITNIDSGLPLVITNTNSQGFGGGSSVSYIPTVPLSSLDVGYRSTSSGINYFGSPAAAAADFRPIQLSTDTRTGRGYTLRGPKFWSVDSRIGKKTPITERMGAEFSADFFNLFNHPTFVSPTLNLANPATFGSVASTFVPANRVNGARWIQFGLKLTF